MLFYVMSAKMINYEHIVTAELRPATNGFHYLFKMSNGDNVYSDEFPDAQAADKWWAEIHEGYLRIKLGK